MQDVPQKTIIIADWHSGLISPEDIQYAFTTQGLKILSLEYPHAAANCEPAGVVVPWSRFQKFLTPKYQQIFLNK